MRWSTVLKASAKTNLANYKKAGYIPRDITSNEVNSRGGKGVFRGKTINEVVKLLRYQFEGTIKDEEGNLIKMSTITSRKLMNDSKLTMNIFKHLNEMRKVDKRPISRIVLFTLLGINPKSLTDKTKVTKQIDNLLAKDKNTERAVYLLKLSGNKNTVAMNRVIESTLKNGDVKDALKIFNDCKKWKYKPNDQTFVILFDGISKNLSFKEYSQTEGRIFQTLKDMYDTIETPTISIFNALLSCLVRNLNDNQLSAWEFFDNLNDLKPDNTTFTIFIRGLCKNRDFRIKKLADRNIVKMQKNKMVFLLNRELVTNVELISKKLEKFDNVFIVNYLKAFDGYHYNTLGLQQLKDWCDDFKLMSDELGLNFNASKKLQDSKDKELSQMNSDSKIPMKYADVDMKKKTTAELNLFLIQIILEYLYQLDRPVQFLKSCWYLLKTYGGVNFKTYPTLKDLEVEVSYETPTEKIIDMKLVESMMFYIHQMFLKEQKSSLINIQMLKYMKSSRIQPTDYSYLNVVQMISEELHYFIRYNYNQLKEVQKENRDFRILKDPLKKDQIEYLVRNLKSLLEVAKPLPKTSKNKKSKKDIEVPIIDKKITQSVKTVYDKISHCNWIEVNDEDTKKLKGLIKSLKDL